MATTSALRRAVAIVAILNLAYFGVEFTMALTIDAVSLLADSVDFLEDAAVNLLVLLALSWRPQARARMGMALAGFLLVPAVAFLWALWSKFSHPAPPEAFSLGVTGAGALVVNLACAFILASHHHTGGSLSRAAFLSARNDALANVGIIAAGLATLITHSLWPDVIVGLAIALMNLGAAREVWEAAREEKAAAS